MTIQLCMGIKYLLFEITHKHLLSIFKCIDLTINRHTIVLVHVIYLIVICVSLSVLHSWMQTGRICKEYVYKLQTKHLKVFIVRKYTRKP
jgi:hypothetical protein